APADTHPHNICREGQRRANHSQRLPYSSREKVEDKAVYDTLVQTLEPLLDLIAESIKKYLPEEYKSLSIFCDALPMGAPSAAYPFSGMVLNFCVSTDAHLDPWDDHICVVIPLCTFEGGELGLHEPGLVLEGSAGDVIVFPSCHITHFNLHF
ncbi:hypothetical protein PLICRDRAFT_82571, partial [Plicaturopsis crispa FD-325 SS-3]